MPIIQPTPIDQLPQPPNPADRSNFNSLAYPFTAAMLPMTVQINKAVSDMYNNALEAEAKAGEAGGSAAAAAGSATAANTAKTGAEAARSGAETARNGAQSSAAAAAGSATAANTAKTGAEAARDAAAQSATNAAQSAADAAGVVQGNFGPAIHAATAKGTPADADELAVADSQASWSLKKLTWGNLKAAIWAAFKTIATGGNAKDTLGLGTAATRDVGTASGQVVAQGVGDFLAKDLPFDSTEPYLLRVILLLPTSKAYKNENRRIFGRVTLWKNGGNKLSSIDIDVNCTHNQTIASMRSVEYPKAARFVTVMHGGIQWLAIEADTSDNPFIGGNFVGTFVNNLQKENSLRVISYYNKKTSTVIDSEIHNSIATYASDTTFAFNGKTVLHTGNILTTTGQSTLYPMTQKAVTDAIANIDVSGPRPVKDHGSVATDGSQTVVCNVQESDFHIMSIGTSDTTGTLTIDFANMPNTVGKHFSWHVRLQRGGRKTVAFAQTITWAGGVTPSFGNEASDYDLIMFYKVGNETIRGMLIDAF